MGKTFRSIYQKATNSTTLKMMKLKLVLMGLMLVQCIMSLPYEEVQVAELPEGQLYPLNSNADLDLAQFHHRHHGYGGGYRRGGGFIIAEVVTEEEAMDMVAKPTVLQLIPTAISMTSP